MAREGQYIIGELKRFLIFAVRENEPPRFMAHTDSSDCQAIIESLDNAGTWPEGFDAISIDTKGRVLLHD